MINLLTILLRTFLAGLGLSLAGLRGQTPGASPEKQPTFVGYLTNGGETYFALVPKTGASPLWLRAGESLEGQLVQSFDAAAETITLLADSQRFTLKLEGSARPSPQVSEKRVVTRAEVLAAVRKLIAERDQWKNPRILLSQTSKADYQAFVIRTSPAFTERRVIGITASGDLKFYIAMSNQPHGGLPDLLFGSFSSSAGWYKAKSSGK